jgi:signal transduction histidine kinase
LVLGDAAELCKVVVNLLHNAREATAGLPPRVEVGCAGQAFLRVIDQGCGMSEEFIRTRLFRPFETTKKKGMGIGLYQCRQVIEGHGGRIEVRSTPGEGSVFTVWLPTEEETAG